MKKILMFILVLLLVSSFVNYGYAQGVIESPNNLSVEMDKDIYKLKFNNRAMKDRSFTQGIVEVDVMSDLNNWISTTNTIIERDCSNEDVVIIEIGKDELDKYLDKDSTSYSFRIRYNFDGEKSRFTSFVKVGKIPIFKNESDWARIELMRAQNLFLVSHNISDDISKDITRVEFAELIVKASQKANISKIQNLDVKFDDTDNIFAQKAKDMGLMNGVSENLFNPNERLTKQDLALIIYRIIENLDIEVKTSGRVDDIDLASAYSRDAIEYVVARGIFNLEDGKFFPKRNITREQAIILVLRIVESI